MLNRYIVDNTLDIIHISKEDLFSVKILLSNNAVKGDRARDIFLKLSLNQNTIKGKVYIK